MRNVVVICLDTVRKDFFDQNSNDLQELIDIDVPQCRATSAWSTPSHASMITGKLPHEHGIHTYQRSFAELPIEETFFPDIPDHINIGASANAFAGTPFNFDRYFDIFTQMSSPSQRFFRGLNPVSYNKNNNSSVEAYIDFIQDSIKSDHPIYSISNGLVGLSRTVSESLPLEDIFDDGAKPILNKSKQIVENTSEPYFVFINLMDAHLPLKPHRGLRDHQVPASWTTSTYEQWNYMNNRDGFQEYWEYREELYAATIDYLSQKVSLFIRDILEMSSDPVSFIITSDHGENLGLPEEDGLVNHTSSLSEGLLHVPLSIINPPSSINSPGDTIVSHLDLPELIVAIANGDSFEWSATPSAEVMGMGPNPDPPSNKEFWDRTIRASYTDRTKYVWDSQGNKLMREISLDKPSWQDGIDSSHPLPPEILEQFETEIESARDTAIQSQEKVCVSESTESRLEELGYM